MTSRRSLVSLVLVLALAMSAVPLLAVGGITGNPVFDATIADETVTPGEDRPLQLIILNKGRVEQGSPDNPSVNQRVTTARGLTVSVKSGSAPITVRSGPRAVGTLPEGSTPPLQVPISVHEDARPGTYEVPVELSYSYTEEVTQDGTERVENVTEEISVNLTVEPAARFDLIDVASDLRVGATETLTVTVENTGTAAAQDALLALTSQNPALTADGTPTATRFVGNWGPGETRSVDVEYTTARAAKPQPYAMEARATYEDEHGIERRSSPLSFALEPEPSQSFSVVNVTSNVSVGDTGTVALRLRNDGPISVTAATASFRSQTGNLVFGETTTDSRFVGTWPAGETRTVAFDLTATPGAETRSYALSTTVSYEDEEGDPGQAQPRSIGVIPDPEQSFVIGGVSSTLEVGAEGTLSGTIRNTGDASASNVVVTYASSKPSVTPLETEAPVGDLGPDETAEFSLPLELSGTAEAGDKQFTLVAQYRNAGGDRRRSDRFDVLAAVDPDTPVFDVTVDGGTVGAGSSTAISVEVTNTGNEPVTDVSAKLFANDPFSTTDSEGFIAELGPDESTTLSFGVAAEGSARSKTYPVELDFQYDDADGDTLTSETYHLPITVTESGDGGGSPFVFVALAVVVVVVLVVAVYRYVRG